MIFLLYCNIVIICNISDINHKIRSGNIDFQTPSEAQFAPEADNNSSNTRNGDSANTANKGKTKKEEREYCTSQEPRVVVVNGVTQDFLDLGLQGEIHDNLF